jgi:hypothetical protein
VAGKGGRRMNMLQKLCTHVCKLKNPIEIIPGIGDRDKGEQ